MKTPGFCPSPLSSTESCGWRVSKWVRGHSDMESIRGIVPTWSFVFVWCNQFHREACCFNRTHGWLVAKQHIKGSDGVVTWKLWTDMNVWNWYMTGNRPWKTREPSGWRTDLALGWQQRQRWQQEELWFAGSFWTISCFWRQEDRGEGRASSGTGCTCCGNKKHGPLSMYLALSVRGGHNNNMSTDRRVVMPGRMGGEEKVKARREDRRANHETAPTIKQG